MKTLIKIAVSLFALYIIAILLPGAAVILVGAVAAVCGFFSWIGVILSDFPSYIVSFIVMMIISVVLLVIAFKD